MAQSSPLDGPPSIPPPPAVDEAPVTMYWSIRPPRESGWFVKPTARRLVTRMIGALIGCAIGIIGYALFAPPVGRALGISNLPIALEALLILLTASICAALMWLWTKRPLAKAPQD